MSELTLSIIMPALNEEKNIAEAVNNALGALEKSGIEGEVIAINDGSSDTTGEIIKKIAQENPLVKIINHEKPMGIGFSFWEGVEKAEKDIVVMMPGDNENDADNALDFVHLMKDVDIIVPFIHNVEVRDKMRRLISALYRFIINMSFGIHLNYTNGTVTYRRCILSDIELKSSGFFYQAELLIKLIRKGYLFAEVPNFLPANRGGKSKAMSIKSLFNVVKSYMRLMFEIHIRMIEAGKDYRKLNENSISHKKKLYY